MDQLTAIHLIHSEHKDLHDRLLVYRILINNSTNYHCSDYIKSIFRSNELMIIHKCPSFKNSLFHEKSIPEFGHLTNYEAHCELQFDQI